MNRKVWMFVAVAAVVAAGCAKDDKTNVPRHPSAIPTDGDVRFEQAREPDPTANTRFAAGQLMESQQRYAAALAQYKAALELDPKHQPTLFRLAQLYSQLGQHDDSIATWKRYIRVTDQPATGYSNLGYACELAGRPAEAEEAYRKGIEIDPRNQPCRVNYGLMLARRGRIEEAKEQMSAVLTPAQVHYNLGSVHEQQGRAAEARLEYRRALELDPGLSAARKRLAALE